MEKIFLLPPEAVPWWIFKRVSDAAGLWGVWLGVAREVIVGRREEEGGGWGLEEGGGVWGGLNGRCVGHVKCWRAASLPPTFKRPKPAGGGIPQRPTGSQKSQD